MSKQPIGKLDHIGIAVKSLVEARKFWEGVMGAKFMYDAENPRAGYKLVELDLNGLTVELLEPLGDDSFLHGYLAKRGEGMHHLTFALSDVKKTASELKDSGVRVVDIQPGDIRTNFNDAMQPPAESRARAAWDLRPCG